MVLPPLSKPISRLSSSARAMLMSPLLPRVLATSLSVLALTRALVEMPGVTGFHGHFAHGQAVAVGGQEGDEIVLDLHPHAGEDRQGVVLAGRDDHLGDGLGEGIAGDGAADCGQRRQRRVFGLGHRGQVEAASAACERYFVAVGFDVDGCGRQAAADVREQASGHQDGAFGADVSGDFEPCGGLVIEAREADGTGFSLQEQA